MTTTGPAASAMPVRQWNGFRQSENGLDMKSTLKRLIPNFVLQSARHLIHGNPTPKEAFEKVYLNGIWGKSNDPSDPFYSGAGSHMPGIVPIYVNAIEYFLQSLGARLDAVDLGCGDFAIGSKIRSLCNQYIACDVVESLIVRNREKYKDLGVDFRTLDITADSLPPGDVVFIRQVLQHLSNKQIKAVVSKVQHEYKYLVLTEHLPSTNDFIPNVDKAVGPDIRLHGRNGSGVILTEAPFNLRVVDTSLLCEVPDSNSVIRTLAYRLR
jgi:hypothetical protein